jgi:ABC-2 type transport system permease protein
MAVPSLDSELRAQRFTQLAATPMQRIGAASGGFGGFWSTLAEVFGRREMLDLLIRRDLKARYKDSALGFIWTLIRPLTQLLIYYVVLGQFLGAARGIPNFAIYVFTGLTAFGLFSEAVSTSTASIVSNTGLVKKIYLPREIFPLSSIGASLFNFGIQLGILLLATLALRQFPATPNIVYVIPALAVILVYATAFGLILSAVNVYLRDIQYLVEIGLMILMWASPVVYSWTMVKNSVHHGWIVDLYVNNPLTLAVMGFQKAIWMNGAAHTSYPSELWLRLAIAFVVGLVIVFIGQRVFSRLQGNFAQEL